jgi:argininosuccinate synthase
MEADPTQAYNQSDATGFIRLNALRLKVAAAVRPGPRFTTSSAGK